MHREIELECIHSILSVGTLMALPFVYLYTASHTDEALGWFPLHVLGQLIKEQPSNLLAFMCNT